ncbi:peptide-methionine (S)-S-oxide reductase [Cycloclasticus sp. 46_83_sub15_T18]|nr:peptide-methionine (S)-S-oxide reductase [Cycloclasticus sp. 46_83_sub15_T18]OUR83222.1 peptide-methionine (S)-S-oxide reductase [Cycloclasticus sp. 46_120_T64]
MNKLMLPTAEEALAGRNTPMQLPSEHYVHRGHRLQAPFPAGLELAVFGMGCFWGAERKFWSLAGVYSTAVGYSAGFTSNPSYEEVCSGMTGHNEVVLVVYDPATISYAELLTVFWQSHNPTQGMAQGNDQGTQYRSGIYYRNTEQLQQAEKTRLRYQQGLTLAGFADITTELVEAAEFYYAEHYHQQYLAKNPAGYCGLGGTGVSL